MKSYKDLKVAFVTDWMLGPSGSDRYMLSLLKIFPQAEIYTAAYYPDAYKGVESFTFTNPIHETFIGRIPKYKFLQRKLNVLTPFAFEALDLSGFDLVIVMSAGFAKSVITSMETCRVDILFTPPRALWMGDKKEGPIHRKVRSFLQRIDMSVSKRMQNVISISGYVAARAIDVYGIDTEIIYPGVDELWFGAKERVVPGDYFVTLSRLYRYKNIEKIIRACEAARQKLKIIGSGPDMARLQKLANPKYIEFMGNKSETEIISIYREAKAFIFSGIEDFGYVPVEAMATGLPVIAYYIGGVAEVMAQGGGGRLYESQRELIDIISNWDDSKFPAEVVESHARLFSEQRFHNEINNFLKTKLEPER